MEDEESYGLYRYRWVVLAAYMVVAALTQVMWLSYAPITSQVEKLMGVSELKVVLLATMFPLLFIPISIPSGILIDRKGYRYGVLIGATLTAGFSFLRLFSGNYTLVLIGMVGIAIGQPFVLNSITKMVSTWFPTKESGLATGLATLASFLGMMIALALTPVLLNSFGKNKLSSLRLIMLIYGLAAIAGLVVFVILARAHPPKPPKRIEHDVVTEGAVINWRSIRAIFRLHNFRLLCAILFIGSGTFIAFLQLIEKIMKPKGISSATAGNIGAVMVFAGVAGCVIMPSISDKIMRRKPFILLATIVAIPTIFLIGAVENTVLLFVIGGVIGFSILSAYPLMLAFAEETTGAALTGTATSLLLLLGEVGGVVITLTMEGIKGATGGVSGSFFWALVFVAVLLVFGLWMALMLREKPLSTLSPDKLGLE